MAGRHQRVEYRIVNLEDYLISQENKKSKPILRIWLKQEGTEHIGPSETSGNSMSCSHPLY